MNKLKRVNYSIIINKMKYNNEKIDKFMDWLQDDNISYSLPSARTYKIFQSITNAENLNEEEEKLLNLICQETILNKAAIGDCKESTAKMILENDFSWSEKSEQKVINAALEKLSIGFFKDEKGKN